MVKMIAAVEGAASTFGSPVGWKEPNPKAAATLTHSDAITFVIGEPGQAMDLPVLPLFHETVLDFLDDLSRSLLDDPAARQFPDVAAFAFWCRRLNMVRQRALYPDRDCCIGRGLVFHVSPSNVPIMFAYTLVLGLLSGNANIVRLPSREHPQIDLLCRRIDGLLHAHPALSPRITCVRYDRDQIPITRALSAACDVRVIWGGDATVREIRELPLQPGAFDMVFPDRYSLAVIDSGAWLSTRDPERHVGGFFNDTYASDQRSCSAPRMVLWLGEHVERARERFWGLLDGLLASRLSFPPLGPVGNLEYAYWILAQHPGSRLSSGDSMLTRVWCDCPQPELLETHPGGGVIIESGGSDLRALLPLLRRRCQTLSYFGVPLELLAALLREAGPRGVDRVVPIGRTLDFSLRWDGYDTLRMLSRRLDLVPDTVEIAP